MAATKVIRKTLSAEAKKSGLVTAKAPAKESVEALQGVPRSTTDVSPDQKREIIRETLLAISAAKDDELPVWPQPWPADVNYGQNWGNHFLWASSQINTDLAAAADVEANRDVFPDDGDMFNLFSSPMYWKLRETFVENAESGNSYSLMELVWRCWNAGRLSPRRLSPRSEEERRESRRQQNEAMRRSKE